MKPVCVLGNGQLGRMLRQAGEPLGIAVYPVGLDAEPEAVPYQNSVITAEIERWPETALTRELATHGSFVNRDIFPRLADRLTQKQLLDQLKLATAPWQLLACTPSSRCRAAFRWARWRLARRVRPTPPCWQHRSWRVTTAHWRSSWPTGVRRRPTRC